jgi:2,3-bisphosphoglycerate-dependent phosphoglycerate mutase
VLLVRHCESTGQAPEAPLTVHGRDQARQLAGELAVHPLVALVASPFRRARETLEPLAALSGLPIHVDSRLEEWNVPFVPPTDWPAGVAPFLRGQQAQPPGFEPLAMARARGLAAFHEALAAGGGTRVLVSHGKLLALVVAALRGVDPFDVFVTIENPYVFAVDPGPGGVVVRDVAR